MALQHVVMFTWAADAPDDQDALVTEALATLPSQIPEIRAYRFGPDLGLTGTADYAVVAVFDDADAFATYRDHPAHQRFIAEHISGKVESRSAVQFAIDDLASD